MIGNMKFSALLDMFTGGEKLTPPRTPPRTPPGSLVWAEEFDAPIAWGARWVGDRTSAFRYCDHNPDDSKLDWLDPGCVTVSDGVATFTATPDGRTLENGRPAWRTGLLTTEYSDEAFRVRTGDLVETRVRLPSGRGPGPRCGPGRTARTRSTASSTTRTTRTCWSCPTTSTARRRTSPTRTPSPPAAG